MDLTTAVEPVTTLKTRSAELIRRARDSGQPIVITQNGRPAAVIQDVETYQKQPNALLLLKLMRQGEDDHRQGRSISHSRVKAHFRRKLKELEQRV